MVNQIKPYNQVVVTKTHSDKGPLLKDPLIIALACAVVVHICLLFIRFGLNNDTSLTVSNPLTVQLQNTIEPSAEPSIDDQEISQPQLVQPQKKVVTRSVEAEVEEQKLVTDSKSVDQPTTAATIINSAEYKQWIKSETINHIDNNPNSLNDFADTFVLPVEVTLPDIETELSPLATGLTDIRRNGKVTCVSHLRLPFQNDFSNGLIVTTKDCTPPQKFVLNTK